MLSILSQLGKRRVTVRVSEFSLEALAGEDGKGAERVPARLVQALRLYLGDRGSDRPGWAYPAFGRDREGGEVELELFVDEGLWQALEEESGRQGASASQMVAHAALYYAAELSSGRIAERVLEGLEDEEGAAGG